MATRFALSVFICAASLAALASTASAEFHRCGDLPVSCVRCDPEYNPYTEREKTCYHCDVGIEMTLCQNLPETQAAA